MRRSLHRRWSLPLAVVALIAASPASAEAVETEHPGRAVASSRLIPVWAFVNGAAPVKNARVGVVVAGTRLRQANGRAWKRTNVHGVAVLRMRRVPRRFTVVVRGGRAEGLGIRGRQRKVVRAYRHAGVVEVSPLTTLLAQLGRQHPRLSHRRALRAVKRYFHVPRWADLEQDLRDTGDEWFDARAYLRDVRRSGSIDRLNRRLAPKIVSGEARRARAERLPTAIAAQKRWRDMTAGQLVKAAFKKLLAGVLEGVANQAIGAGIGALLNLAQSAGLITLPKSELEEVRDQLDAISEQLTQLEGKLDDVNRSIARSNASQLLHQSDTVLARIDHAQAQLALLARLGPNDPTQKRFAATIDAYVGANLLDAPAILNRQLNPELAIGDNVVKATSRLLAATEQFFDAEDSARVRQVYDYFATYQLQLSVLLLNYWNAHPDTYSVATREATVAQIEKNVVTTQEQSLKPPVESYTFFDMRTPQFMWGTYPGWTITALRMEDERLRTSRRIVMGRYDNWQMPADGDYRNLLDGATGQPRAWLQSQVAVPLEHQLLWASDSLKRRGAPSRLEVTVFDLHTGRPEEHGYGNTPWYLSGCEACDVNDPRVRDFLGSKTAGLIFLRYLGPGESYWW